MLFAVKVSRWRQLATVGIVGGLIAVAIANVGRQQKFAARIDLLWQTLEFVEQKPSPIARLAWVSEREAECRRRHSLPLALAGPRARTIGR